MSRIDIPLEVYEYSGFSGFPTATLNRAVRLHDSERTLRFELSLPAG